MKSLMSGLAAAAAGVVLGAAVASTAVAAEYPARPIQIIVPYNAGGGTDLSTRLFAQALEKALDGTAVVRNQPGGGGSIGTSATAHAKADGYTIGTGSQGPIAMLPHYGGIDYTINDFDFLALQARNLMVIGVGKNAPFQDAKGFFEYAKAHPGELTVGNSGAGGANHIAMEGLAMAAGVKVKSMPFGGAVAAVTAVLGGHIQAAVASPAEFLTHVRAGNITPILVMEDARIEQYPDTPTAKELGVDFAWSSWKGIVAPKGLPKDVRAKLAAGVEKALKDPTYVEKMKELGEFLDYRPGDKYEALARHDSEIAEKVIRSLGMYGMNAKK